MADWTDVGAVATLVATVASAVAAVFAYRAAAKSADVAERADRRAVELERARQLSALLLAVDRVTVAAIGHDKLSHSTSATLRAQFGQSGGLGGSKHALYEAEILVQREKVADIRRTVSEICPRDEAMYDAMTMIELVALHRRVDSLSLVFEELTARLIDLRDGKV